MNIKTISNTKGTIKFKNKYRIPSARLLNWDYSSDGYYFLTIVSKNHKHYFGEIKNDKMIKNEFGNIAENFWNEIPKHSPNAILDEFIIMPNHIHGIIIINNKNENPVQTPHRCVSNPNGNHETRRCGVSTDNTDKNIIIKNKKSISTIIRSYKSICTKTINKKQNKIFFAWQTRFYDRIIRNENELYYTRRYIINNPLNYNKKKRKPDLSGLNAIIKT